MSGSQNLVDRQLEFIAAADRLKAVTRKNRILDGSRHENTAEHSWHVSLMAMTFAGYAPVGTDIAAVIEMLIVHDLVEIEAGDHWVLDGDRAEVAAKEAVAARRLFGILPAEQGARFHDLWQEFEAGRSPEARFARALDSLHPVIVVWGPGGSGYVHTPLTASFMREHKRAALEPFPELWKLATDLLDAAVRRGTLDP